MPAGLGGPRMPESLQPAIQGACTECGYQVFGSLEDGVMIFWVFIPIGAGRVMKETGRKEGDLAAVSCCPSCGLEISADFFNEADAFVEDLEISDHMMINCVLRYRWALRRLLAKHGIPSNRGVDDEWLLQKVEEIANKNLS